MKEILESFVTISWGEEILDSRDIQPIKCTYLK